MTDFDCKFSRRTILAGGLSASVGMGAATIDTPANGSERAESNGEAPVSFEYAKSKGDSEASENIEMAFDVRFCIHARHCVTRLTKVFREGQYPWMDPTGEDADLIAAVVEMCPSGALQYKRLDGQRQEEPPNNVVVIRENGPYEFRGTLEIDGRPVGYRRTLCRCGKSENKPFCDNSHMDEFVAKGVREPVTDDDEAARLNWQETPRGPLTVKSTNEGPLMVSGNLQVVCGTNAAIAYANEVSLCSCGKSLNKPFCDGSHLG
ncbi:CDGSH iron-sulfur domain-containing protein [Rhizobium sp. FKY42]|uniref:CDGSH iron-sulfur domain-containing protein n=1 Tax=Rhizobium sp. FKY42 TaxID=2562310 RepID=UPI0010BFD6AC|nr:CDGSH iron-sulfur domain-containing protein [Rhizobium sp. FKY42]